MTNKDTSAMFSPMNGESESDIYSTEEPVSLSGDGRGGRSYPFVSETDPTAPDASAARPPRAGDDGAVTNTASAVMTMASSKDPDPGVLPSAAPIDFICLCGCSHYGEAIQLDADAVPKPELQMTRFCRHYLNESGGHTELTEATIWACTDYRPSALHLLVSGTLDWRRNQERVRKVAKGISGTRRDTVLDVLDRVARAVTLVRGER